MMSVLIWWIIVGLIAGWAAGKIMKGGGYGGHTPGHGGRCRRRMDIQRAGDLSCGRHCGKHPGRESSVRSYLSGSRAW